MTTSQSKHLIFLTSQPRPGSTLLQFIFSRHPDIHTTPEPWLMKLLTVMLLRASNEISSQSIRPFWGTRNHYGGNILKYVSARSTTPINFLTERRAITNCGIFYESLELTEDWDLNIGLSKAYSIAYVSEPKVGYHRYGKGISSLPFYNRLPQDLAVVTKNILFLQDLDVKEVGCICKKVVDYYRKVYCN